MDSYDINKIKHIENAEVIRRLLIKYFIDKGYSNSFDRQIYPALLQDLPFVIPILSSKIEIQPNIADLDSTLGKAVISWNMFVLGTHRMYLGDTFHNSLKTLARQIQSGFILPENSIQNCKNTTTPRRIILFIMRILENHTSGYVDLTPSQDPPNRPGGMLATRQNMMGTSQQFYNRS